ncbi:UDP-N-acetylglucosamine diphosphorylase/glucosamine-1-phosphate N-acetyltransferase [Bordetella holmesii ATCC 51541]|nr:UDP-N-acetylglucosamine diphosphorylase/glucosamine-1-phosphate N-acetyltransferase [Bordetella holmesii ATCC 51541]
MLNVVILAAGLGKRMQSDLPKVLHTLAGRPMLSHVLDSARQLDPARIIVVVGHRAERVEAAYAAEAGLSFALQRPQQGTGHAVQQAVPQLVDGDGADDATLVLYGDVPLVQPETLRRLMQARGQGVAVLTEVLADATGYGRIVRDAQGQIARIVEHKDASEQERAIQEVNTGILIAPTAKLKDWLARIDNKNAQGEYYLTDIIGLAVAEGVPVHAAHPGANWETLGVNSRVQQAELERRWQQELARRQLDAGVTLADPARFDQRGALECGRDVYIDVGCVFEGKVTLGDGVRVGPHCVLRDVQIAAGTQIDAFSHLQQAKVGADGRLGPYARLRPGPIWRPGCTSAILSRSRMRCWAKVARPIIWPISVTPISARASTSAPAPSPAITMA